MRYATNAVLHFNFESYFNFTMQIIKRFYDITFNGNSVTMYMYY